MGFSWFIELHQAYFKSHIVWCNIFFEKYCSFPLSCFMELFHSDLSYASWTCPLWREPVFLSPIELSGHVRFYSWATWLTFSYQFSVSSFSSCQVGLLTVPSPHAHTHLPILFFPPRLLQNIECGSWVTVGPRCLPVFYIYSVYTLIPNSKFIPPSIFPPW